MLIKGRINKWDIILQTFTLGTPIGDIGLVVDGCETRFLDELVEAMKNRKSVTIEVGEHDGS